LGTVQSARNASQKGLQVQFMEEENANLRQRVVDLQQTLKINKDIIKTVLEPQNANYELVIKKMQAE
jgi:hypothetical protein